MISLFHACYSSLLSGTGRFVPKLSSSGYFSSRNISHQHSCARSVNLELLTKLRVRCYSSKKKSGGGSSRKQKLDPKSLMKDDKEAFFVVRKGDLIGVYKSLSDCQAQVGTSICDPPVSVYKGYSMPKDKEKYLLSYGLKNALYTLRASDATTELFGSLLPCPLVYEELHASKIPTSSRGETSGELMPKKRSHEAMGSEYGRSCVLEFDGASKGNPGQAGAGAVIRADDGSLICRLREGLGVATNNVAEYRAFILGLRYALGKGFTSIRVRGDSKLVCMQIQGLWRVKNQNISNLFDEAKKLKDRFISFEISHILRDLNSEADSQANLAVDLADGQVQEVIDK